jgi:hypothetical protein
VLGIKRDDLDISGVASVRLFAAISVYVWRMANRDAPVGGWAATIPGVKLPEAKAGAKQPEVQPEQPKRRVLNI